MANGKVGSRWAWTISAVYYDLQRESGTSLTIGAGPGTGEKRQMEYNSPFLRQDVPFILEILRLGKLK